MQIEPPLSARGSNYAVTDLELTTSTDGLNEHKGKCPVWISLPAVPSLVVRDLQDAFECVVVEGAAAVRPTKQQQCAAYAAICALVILGVFWSGAA